MKLACRIDTREKLKFAMIGGCALDARIRILFHKTRFLWIGFLVLAVLALIAFVVLNLTFNKPAGAFEKVKAPYTLEIPASPRSFERLSIDAPDVNLEVGMTSAVKKPTAYLYGKNYTNQKVVADLNQDRVHIQYKPTHRRANEGRLTMRVLLPETDLRNVRITGDQGNVHIDHLRTDGLSLKKGNGRLTLKRINADCAEIFYKKGNVRMEDNRVSDFQLNGVSGEMILRNNVMRQLDVESKEGSIFLYTPNFKGNTKIKTDEGHITAVTKRLPWSLLISAKASGDGDVQVNYHKRFWKKPDVILKNKQAWQGAVGDNPRTILTLQTKDGHITVDQRNRYTDTQADSAA